MGLFDTLIKNEEAVKEQKGEYSTPPPQGHSLAEIRQDKNKFHLFGELLKQDSNVELGARFMKGELQEGDIAMLEEVRKKLSEKIIHVEKIEKLLTTEKLKIIARSSPDFEKIVNEISLEGALKVIKSQLMDIAVTDVERFGRLSSALEAKESYLSGDFKATEEKVEKLLKEKNITQQEYEDVRAIKESDKRKKALEELSYKTNGGFKRAIHSLGNLIGKNWAQDTTFDELKKSDVSFEQARDQLNEANKNIGAMLFMTFNENKNMLAAHSKELLGEPMPQEERTGFKDIKKEANMEAEFLADWENEKKREGFDAEDEAGQNAIRDGFMQRAKDHYKKKNEGKGFWRTVISSMIESFIDNKKAELK